MERRSLRAFRGRGYRKYKVYLGRAQEIERTTNDRQVFSISPGRGSGPQTDQPRHGDPGVALLLQNKLRLNNISSERQRPPDISADPAHMKQVFTTSWSTPARRWRGTLDRGGSARRRTRRRSHPRHGDRHRQGKHERTSPFSPRGRDGAGAVGRRRNRGAAWRQGGHDSSPGRGRASGSRHFVKEYGKIGTVIHIRPSGRWIRNPQMASKR